MDRKKKTNRNVQKKDNSSNQIHIIKRKAERRRKMKDQSNAKVYGQKSISQQINQKGRNWRKEKSRYWQKNRKPVIDR